MASSKRIHGFSYPGSMIQVRPTPKRRAAEAKQAPPRGFTVIIFQMSVIEPGACPEASDSFAPCLLNPKGEAGDTSPAPAAFILLRSAVAAVGRIYGIFENTTP